MRIPTIGRLAATALAACGLALAAAAPAAAATVPLQFGPGSDLSVAGRSHDIGGVSSGQSCSANGTQNSISPDISGGVIDLDVADWSTYERDFFISSNGSTFRLQVVPTADTTGTISGSNVSLNVSYKLVFKNCAGTAVVCETNVINQILQTSSYAGSNPPASGDTMSLDGLRASVSTRPGCNLTLGAFLRSAPAGLQLDLVA